MNNEKEIRGILVAAIQRDVTDESLREVAVIAANAIYWRNKRIRELEEMLAVGKPNAELSRGNDVYGEGV